MSEPKLTRRFPLERAIQGLAAITAFCLLAAGMVAACDLSGPAADGKRASAQCRQCHVFDAGKPSLPTGPNLHDVMGRRAASRSDFKYSPAMKAVRAKDLSWNTDNLFAYLDDPKLFTRNYTGADLNHGMFFSLHSAAERRNLIAYLAYIKGKPGCD